MNAPIRTLVVDDEVHARRGLRTLLADEPDIVVVGESADGAEAVRAIRELKPDLVFLDIEMPERNGLEVVAEVGPESMPTVVFVTAYDEYAVAAFEAHAIDYVLKPFTNDRFRATVRRAREHVARGDGAAAARHLARLVADGAHTPAEDRFTVKVGDVFRVVKVEDIDWVEAHEYYSKLHVGKDTHMVRQTMGALEERLPAAKFARIHRSTIVNVDRIRALEPLFQGDFNVILEDGTELRMSRRRREVLADRLPNLS